MDATSNFAVPMAKQTSTIKTALPCPFTPAGILQPAHLQPPPMFGPRGATIPPKHLAPYTPKFQHRPRFAASNESHHNYENRPKFQSRNNNYRPRYNHHQQHTGKPNHHHQPYNNRPSPQFNRTVVPNNYTQCPSTSHNEFWCETCDREFKGINELTEHKQEHIKCNIDGCKFEGHELMVAKHIQMQHNSGLYDKIKNLSTPEEIEKWREERRRRFPTKENVELRQQIQEAKQKRGERINDPKNRFGRKSDRKKPGQENNTRDTKIQETKKRRRKRKVKPVHEISAGIAPSADTEKIHESNEILNGKIPMFQGTSQMYTSIKVKPTENALTGLIGAYGTSDDENSDDSESSKNMLNMVEDQCELPQTNENHLKEIVIENKPSAEVIMNISTINESPSTPILPTIDNSIGDSVFDYDSNNEAPEEELVQRIPNETIPIPEQSSATHTTKKQKKDERNASNKRESDEAKQQKKGITRRVRKSGLDLTKRYRHQNTMLEKLLQKDIRHERNVLLQCVRYVVENNFFNVGQKKNNEI